MPWADITPSLCTIDNPYHTQDLLHWTEDIIVCSLNAPSTCNCPATTVLSMSIMLEQTLEIVTMCMHVIVACMLHLPHTGDKWENSYTLYLRQQQWYVAIVVFHRY